MKTIKQRQKSDCAVAAIAMATGRSYNAVKAEVGSTRGGLEIGEIEGILPVFGRWRLFRPRRDWTLSEFADRYPKAIVVLGAFWLDGHCVAVVDGEVHDPAGHPNMSAEVVAAFLPVSPPEL